MRKVDASTTVKKKNVTGLTDADVNLFVTEAKKTRMANSFNPTTITLSGVVIFKDRCFVLGRLSP